jgi:hypothetical protein
MSTIHRFRSVFLGSAAFLALALFAPGVVNADDAIPLVAPVAAPSTDAAPVMAPVAGPFVAGDIGSLQEDRLLAIVAAAPGWDETSGYRSVEASRAAASALLAPVAAPSWDETSGYRSVEASRATIGHPAASTSASTTQVPADVRWAPVRAIAPEASLEANHPVSPDYLSTALASGRRTESAHLAAVSLPGEAVSVNPSDDWIAAALFGDELSR